MIVMLRKHPAVKVVVKVATRDSRGEAPLGQTYKKELNCAAIHPLNDNASAYNDNIETIMLQPQRKHEIFVHAFACAKT